MADLTSDRITVEARGDRRVGNVAASQLIYAGSIVMRNAAGFLVKGTEATGLIGAGRAHQRVDNSAGGDGDLTLNFRPGFFAFANAGGADLITDVDIRSLCYAQDDQTVAKTDNGGARSPVGTVAFLEDNAVFVRFDEAMTKNFSA